MNVPRLLQCGAGVGRDERPEQIALGTALKLAFVERGEGDRRPTHLASEAL